jgi:hypothetical protein
VGEKPVLVKSDNKSMKLKEATYFPDAEELTKFAFEQDAMSFIQKLIGDSPLKADVSDRLKRFGFDAPKMIIILTTPEIDGVPESAVVMCSKKIKSGGIDENGEALKDEFQVAYKVPRRDPKRGIKGVVEKLRNIYIKLFENHIVEGTILNEDGEGGMCGDGGAMEGMGGASTTFSAGNYPYDSNALGKKKSGKQDEEKDTDFTIMRRSIYKVTESKKKMKRPIGRVTMFITEDQLRHIKEAVEMDTAFGDFGYDAPGLKTKKTDKSFDHSNLVTRKENEAEWHKNLEEEKKKAEFTLTQKTKENLLRRRREPGSQPKN